MSYAAIPQKDPLLDESSRPADRKKAATGAAIFTLLLILSVFMRFFSKIDPIPEPQGVIASFESIEIEETGGGGGGGGEETKEQSSNQQSSSQSKEIETNDDVKSDLSVSKGNSKDAEVKTDPGLDFTNFQGEERTSSNTNNGPGKLGTTGPGKGNGKGFGEGNEEGSGTSLCVSNCNCSNTKWDIGILVSVDAWITVEIKENGSVNSARFAEKGDVKNNKDYTSMNTNATALNKNTQKIVLDCFRGRTYKSTGNKYRITQKMVLKKF